MATGSRVGFAQCTDADEDELLAEMLDIELRPSAEASAASSQGWRSQKSKQDLDGEFDRLLGDWLPRGSATTWQGAQDAQKKKRERDDAAAERKTNHDEMASYATRVLRSQETRDMLNAAVVTHCGNRVADDARNDMMGAEGSIREKDIDNSLSRVRAKIAALRVNKSEWLGDCFTREEAINDAQAACVQLYVDTKNSPKAKGRLQPLEEVVASAIKAEAKSHAAWS